MGHSPPPPKKKISESLSSETTDPIEKIYGRGAKMVRTSSIIMQSLVQNSRCMMAWEKLGVVILFVTLCIVNLNKVNAHQRFSNTNSDIVTICRSILMRISAFFRGKMLFQTF